MKKDGGQAFPVHKITNGGLVPVDGMSLRDWFAGMALMGLLNNAESRICPNEKDNSLEMSNGEILAGNCYAMADYMLQVREES